MINQRLTDLYLTNYERFKSLRNQFPEQTFNGPYFCSPSDLYLQQQIPLLCIGQETYGWKSSDNIEQQMDFYRQFNVGETYTKSSPFWHLIRQLEALFNESSYSSSALNLNRYDVSGGRPKKDQLQAFEQLDDILVSEINILNPKVCIFFTGHKSDYRLEKIYPGIEKIDIPGLPLSSFCILKHENLPVNTFRTYHPAFLRRSKLTPPVIKYLSSLKLEL